MEGRTRKLTEREIAAIRLALAAVLVDLNRKSPMIDRTADDPDILDPLHSSYAKERRMEQDIMDLFEEAEEEVVVYLPE
jgi:hypothetical protein